MAHALFIGPSSAETDLRNFFSQSHWALESEPGLAAAIRRLAREPFPAVLCNLANWKQAAAALSALEHTPVLIVFSDENAGPGGVCAMAPNVYRVQLGRTAPGRIFSLLNHAWRIRNEAG